MKAALVGALIGLSIFVALTFTGCGGNGCDTILDSHGQTSGYYCPDSPK